MDWKHILDLSPRDLSDKQKDKLCESLKFMDVDEDLNNEELKALFYLIQEILRYKDTQVEIFTSEFDEIARKQGIEDAKIIQNLENEIKSLRSSNESRLQTPDSDFRIENENLRSKIKSLKINLKVQAEEIATLKKDNLHLQQESNLLQSELQSINRESDSQSEISDSDKYQQLVDNIQQKNKQISQLLTDIEAVEKENITLKENLVNLRHELKETTDNLNELSKEISDYELNKKELTAKISSLITTKDSLQNKLDDVIKQREDLEAKIEEFTSKLNLKIDQMRILLEDNEAEITQLKKQNKDLKTELNQFSKDKSLNLQRILNEREQQIDDLKLQLDEAAKELDKSVEVIKEISESKNQDISDAKQDKLIQDLKEQLSRSHERCQELQDLLNSAESDAQNQGKLYLDLIKQLDKYEKGEFGLADAVKEVQDLKVQVNVRDKQIFNLVQEVNLLQSTCDEVEKENFTFREKLNLPLDVPVSKNGIVSKQRKQKKLIVNLQNQLELLQEENLAIKVELQKHKRFLTDFNEKNLEQPRREIDYEKKATELLEENESLRKGMHEILNSIQAEKGESLQEIKCESLEKLLHVLDSRHIAGWYHPAMKLQAEVNTLQGINDELRNQLKFLRSELEKSKERIQETETKYQEFSVLNIDKNLITSLALSLKVSDSDVSKINSELLEFLSNYETEMEKCKKINEELEHYRKEFNLMQEQIKSISKEKLEETSILTTKNEELQLENINLVKAFESLQDKLENYLRVSGEENLSSKISNDLVTFNRKCIYLEENEKKLSSVISKLQLELCTEKNQYMISLRNIELSKGSLLHKISTLEKIVENSVPKTEFDAINIKYNELSIKFRDLIDDVNNFKDSNKVQLYKKDIELLNKEKDKLLLELLDIKINKKCENEETNELIKKIAQLELNELSHKQRADHLQSLYDLLKSQLTKCEERCYEFDNQNKLLISENLKLQLTIQELQDKIIGYIVPEDYNTLNLQLNNLEEKYFELDTNYKKLQVKYKTIEAEIKTREMLNFNQSMELMTLKHLLLDLQATSDEKALISRLSAEVVLARICESDAKNRLDNLTSEMKLLNEESKEKDALINQHLDKINIIKIQHNRKFRVTLQVINYLRQQYLGCNPTNSQERVANELKQIYLDKQKAFNEIKVAQKQMYDIILLQEKLNLEVQNTVELKESFQDRHVLEKIVQWQHEKHIIQLNEFKTRRNLEIKELEIQQLEQRLKKQDHQLVELQKELLTTTNEIINSLQFLKTNSEDIDPSVKDVIIETSKEFIDSGTDPINQLIKEKKSIEIQTIEVFQSNQFEECVSALKNEIIQSEQVIEELKRQLKEKESVASVVPKNNINVIDDIDAEEYHKIKNQMTELKLKLTEKEEQISKFQSILKEDKDNHCTAALQFQQELKKLQATVKQQQKAYEELKNKNISFDANKTLLDQYVNQVHNLEKHLSEYETSVSTLNGQLQSSRQEAVRWKTLANDRLKIIENLRKETDEQHYEEISMYKNEYDKFKEEILNLKQELLKTRVELTNTESTLQQDIQEKDKTIHELNMNLMYLRNDLKLCKEEKEHSSELSDLKMSKELIESENASLKSRYEQILSREKSLKEEIKKLKSQLLKRPVLSKRTDNTDRSIKEQLQKKINKLEKDLEEANEKIAKEALINENRRNKIADDFTQWEKLKRWQQSFEKCNNKLLAKTDELDKVQQSYNSAKAIISRLEREKHILEGKLKTSKLSSSSIPQLSNLEYENSQLKNEIDVLKNKLEMQQHHSGGLGAAMLQEKLEAQERKIAILELSGKGTSEVTAELERLNNLISSLQKCNLRLEAENLELNLDLKKITADAPHQRERIQHLERYIEVLKAEKTEPGMVTNASDQAQLENKKILELEKTVLSLKRLVERLQTDNKRLQSRSCSCSCSSTLASKKIKNKQVISDKNEVELTKLREKYNEYVNKSTKLEEELVKSQKRIQYLEKFAIAKQTEDVSSISIELEDVKAQLELKSELLDKIKALYQKSVAKEKFLQKQVNQLQSSNLSETNLDISNTNTNQQEEN